MANHTQLKNDKRFVSLAKCQRYALNKYLVESAKSCCSHWIRLFLLCFASNVLNDLQFKWNFIIDSLQMVWFGWCVILLVLCFAGMLCTIPCDPCECLNGLMIRHSIILITIYRETVSRWAVLEHCRKSTGRTKWTLCVICVFIACWLAGNNIDFWPKWRYNEITISKKHFFFFFVVLIFVQRIVFLWAVCKK